MENTENKLKAIKDRLTPDEFQTVLNEVSSHLPSMAFMEFYVRVYKAFAKSYLIISSIVMLVFIYQFSWPLYSFFLPLLPMALILFSCLIEANILTYRMTKLHTILIKQGIRIGWDELMEVVTYLIFFRKNNIDTDDESFY